MATDAASKALRNGFLGGKLDSAALGTRARPITIHVASILRYSGAAHEGAVTISLENTPGALHWEDVSMGRNNFAEMNRNARRGVRRDAGMRVASALFLSFVLIGLPGCGGSINGLPVESDGSPIPPGDPAYQTAVQIKYLGAGGVLIKRGDDSLLTAPFFSNPSMLRVAFGEIRPLPEQIKRFLGPTGGKELAGATAVLVGHAHYDHLMDVPYIKKNYLPLAKIYGSETMKYTLAGDRTLKADEVVSVEKDARSVNMPEQPVKWWPESPASPRMRFMALKSEHAPVFAGLKFFEGGYHQPLQALPTSAWGWLEGQTLAYLIDFLGADGKTVEFRIHYQDAASTPPLGFPPRFNEPPDQRPVDLAIVCMPGFDQVKDYPKEILERLKPRFVIIIHWENFFALLPDDPRDLRVVPTVNAERFLASLKSALPEGASFKLPAPGTWMRYAP